MAINERPQPLKLLLRNLRFRIPLERSPWRPPEDLGGRGTSGGLPSPQKNLDRIFAVLISMVSCMDLVQGFSARAWPLRKRSRGQCTTRSVYILLFALQLLFSRSISFGVSFRSIAFFFAHPTLPVYTYSYFFHSRSYRIDMGVFLALWQWA